MKSKTIRLIASLFALCLMLLLQSASKAVTVPGWIYTSGVFLQNQSYGQMYISVYDYGTFTRGQLYFVNTISSDDTVLIRSLPASIHYVKSGSISNDVTMIGPGTIAKTSGNIHVTLSGQLTVHLWRGIVGGVNGTWVQAELWSADATPVLLWATGPTWPAAHSSPTKLSFCIIQPLVN